ncbi:hypothetical protein MNBD_GAMMA22-73 [hydrothermal vent metagenome]|uniref:Uncharacterized protein n=1 Tax=hydrothermal vent metagenome TaxID=652676 RepID=A0A3B1AEZ3_9ZZZZ
MNKFTAIITSFAVQIIITSCTGYGIIYDDKHLEVSTDEQQCLDQPNTDCLLNSARAISTSMSDAVAQSEALNVLAKTQYQLGRHATALELIAAMPILALKFNSLFELTQITKTHNNSTAPLLKFADSLIDNSQAARDKIPALLLRAVLAYKNQNLKTAQHYLAQARAYMENTRLKQHKALNLPFFSKILPTLMELKAFNTINSIIVFQTTPAKQMLAQLKFLVLLHKKQPKQAKLQLGEILIRWPKLSDKSQRLRVLAAVIQTLVRFDRLDEANQILDEQDSFIVRTTLRSIIIQQLANMGQIAQAKHALTRQLRDIRHYSIPKQTEQKSQALRDNFELNKLRAQAIADVALALANGTKMIQAVYLAEQIQPLMGHIQGYSLTKIALMYAQQGDINSALLTMESIHRGVNRAACLAQISAVVAKAGDIPRAKIIAARVDRQSWRDIALSEISISLAQKNTITAAMTVLNEIQRSYSSVYAMAKIALVLQTRTNQQTEK